MRTIGATYLIQFDKYIIHANYPLFPLTFLQHFITYYLASIHLDILIYIYIYICSFHVLMSLHQCCKSHQKISLLSYFPMSRILHNVHIATISASSDTYFFVGEELNFDDVGAFAEDLW